MYCWFLHMHCAKSPADAFAKCSPAGLTPLNHFLLYDIRFPSPNHPINTENIRVYRPSTHRTRHSSSALNIESSKTPMVASLLRQATRYRHGTGTGTVDRTNRSRCTRGCTDSTRVSSERHEGTIEGHGSGESAGAGTNMCRAAGIW